MKKKTLLVAVAMVLVCVMSVMGTVAYMQNTTGGGGKLAEDLTLVEHLVTAKADGEYTYAKKDGATITQVSSAAEASIAENGNSYQVMPGMELPKDPTITITGKTAAPAYLYFEVVNPLPKDDTESTTGKYTYSFDGWTKLNVVGANGGEVYVYGPTTDGTIITADNVKTAYPILTDNKITVRSDATDLAKNTTMTFYAYLAQATVGANSTPATVYDTVFTP